MLMKILKMQNLGERPGICCFNERISVLFSGMHVSFPCIVQRVDRNAMDSDRRGLEKQRQELDYRPFTMSLYFAWWFFLCILYNFCFCHSNFTVNKFFVGI